MIVFFRAAVSVGLSSTVIPRRITLFSLLLFRQLAVVTHICSLLERNLHQWFNCFCDWGFHSNLFQMRSYKSQTLWYLSIYQGGWSHTCKNRGHCFKFTLNLFRFTGGLIQNCLRTPFVPGALHHLFSGPVEGLPLPGHLGLLLLASFIYFRLCCALTNMLEA